jgi:hypothetical protein
MFPGNCYSNRPYLPDIAKGMNKAHGMIALAEDLLHPGERPMAQVWPPAVESFRRALNPYFILIAILHTKDNKARLSDPTAGGYPGRHPRPALFLRVGHRRRRGRRPAVGRVGH